MLFGGERIIHYYGIVITTGAVLGAWMATSEVKRRGYNPEMVWDLLVYLMIGGIIGAQSSGRGPTGTSTRTACGPNASAPGFEHENKSRMSKSSSDQGYDPDLSAGWLDRLAQFNRHFGRFVRDALGVILIAFALMTFFALRRLTQGLLLTPWTEQLLLWFGWGSYLVVLAIGYIGFAFLRRTGTPVSWGRIFALEVAALLTLSLLAALGGNSLTDAEAGGYGGRIGWGLTELFWLGGLFILMVRNL